MPFKITCQCDRVLVVPDKRAGAVIRCPKCERKIQVPDRLTRKTPPPHLIDQALAEASEPLPPPVANAPNPPPPPKKKQDKRGRRSGHNQKSQAPSDKSAAEKEAIVDAHPMVPNKDAKEEQANFRVALELIETESERDVATPPRGKSNDQESQEKPAAKEGPSEKEEPAEKRETAEKEEPAEKKKEPSAKERKPSEQRHESTPQRPAEPERKKPRSKQDRQVVDAEDTKINKQATGPPPKKKRGDGAGSSRERQGESAKQAAETQPPPQEKSTGSLPTKKVRDADSELPSKPPRRPPAKTQLVAAGSGEVSSPREMPPVESTSPSSSFDYAGYRADKGRRQTVVYLAIWLLVLAATSLVPAGMELHARSQLDIWPGIPFWIHIVSLFAGIYVAYAVYLIQLPDWSTIWVVSIVTLIQAMVYALLLGISLLATMQSPLLQSLGLANHLRGGSIALWCVVMICLNCLFSYFGGRFGLSWRNTRVKLARSLEPPVL